MNWPNKRICSSQSFGNIVRRPVAFGWLFAPWLGLELTHSNHAAATAFVKFVQNGVLVWFTPYVG